MKHVILGAPLVALLSLSACGGDPVAADPSPDAPSTSSSATPASSPGAGDGPISVDEVARLTPGGAVRGLAVCGDHVAWVQDASSVVVADWRTGESRAVASTDHSQYYATDRAGCRFVVVDTVNGYNGEDPSTPAQTLTVDLRTGSVARAESSGDDGAPSLGDVPGEGYVVRRRNDATLVVVPTPDGPVVSLPASPTYPGDAGPAADGDLVAYVRDGDHGVGAVSVVRIVRG